MPCKCLGQDLEGSEPPYPVWVWSLTWPDPTAACRVMGRAGLALCRCSCAHPVHGLHTLTCCSRPGRETSSAHRARSAAVPSVPAAQQQPGHRAGRHPQLPSRLATTQVPPGAGQGSGDIPLLVGSQAGVSQASCPALGTVPWLCLTQLCPAPHSSPFSSGTRGWQCHVQAALPPRDRPRGCLPGTRPHLPARAPSPTMRWLKCPGLTLAMLLPTTMQLWQSRQARQAVSSSHSSAHLILPPTAATGLSQR